MTSYRRRKHTALRSIKIIWPVLIHEDLNNGIPTFIEHNKYWTNDEPGKRFSISKLNILFLLGSKESKISSLGWKYTELWKESLNSDSQVINSTNIKSDQSPVSLAHWTQKIPWHMTLEMQVLAWDRHKNMAGLNWLMGSQPSPLNNWISNSNTWINKW